MRNRGSSETGSHSSPVLKHGDSWSVLVERVALPLGMLALQALPLGALLQLLAAWTTNDASQALLPTWALLVALIEAFYLARWLTRQPAFRGWIVFCIGLGALATLLAAWYLRFYNGNGPFWSASWLGVVFQDFQTDSARVEVPIGVAVLLALLWWRGLWLGREKLEFEPVARSFKVGFAALVVALLLSGTTVPSARDGLVVQLGLTLPVFLFVGLVSLSLARLGEIQRGRRTQGVSQADPTRSWLIAMLALSAALVVLILGIEQAFSYHVLLGVVSALQPVWDAVGVVIGWIAVGLAFILYWVLHPFALAIQAIFHKVSSANQTSKPAPSQRPPLAGKPGLSLPTEWLIAGRWVLIGIGVVIALVIFIRIFRGLAARLRDEEGDEERESLGAAGILGAQLRALLDTLAARFQRKPAAEDTAMVARHSMRALYRRVLHQARARGWGRRAAETPQEFAQRLGPLLSPPSSSASRSPTPASASVPALSGAPDVSDPALEMLTSAYEQARYGDYEPSAGEVAALTADVDRLLQRMAQQ